MIRQKGKRIAVVREKEREKERGPQNIKLKFTSSQ